MSIRIEKKPKPMDNYFIEFSFSFLPDVSASMNDCIIFQHDPLFILDIEKIRQFIFDAMCKKHSRLLAIYTGGGVGINNIKILSIKKL